MAIKYYSDKQREERNFVIKICVSCDYIGYLKEGATHCPDCELGSLCYFETLDKFKRFVALYRDKDTTLNLRVLDPILIKAYNEGMQMKV